MPRAVVAKSSPPTNDNPKRLNVSFHPTQAASTKLHPPTRTTVTTAGNTPSARSTTALFHSTINTNNSKTHKRKTIQNKTELEHTRTPRNQRYRATRPWTSNQLRLAHG